MYKDDFNLESLKRIREYKKTKSFNKARIAALKRVNYNVRNLFGQVSTSQIFK